GRTSFSVARLVGLSIEGLTSFSVAPLRFASLLGALLAVASFMFGLSILWETWIDGKTTPGYASLVVGMMTLGGVQLLMIGILGDGRGTCVQPRIGDDAARCSLRKPLPDRVAPDADRAVPSADHALSSIAKRYFPGTAPVAPRQRAVAPRPGHSARRNPGAAC